MLYGISIHKCPLTTSLDVIGRRGPRLVHDLEDLDTIEHIAEAKGDAVTIEHAEERKVSH